MSIFKAGMPWKAARSKQFSSKIQKPTLGLVQGFGGPSRTLWMLVGYLALIFLMGGGSRYDVLSTMIIRPLAALVCGVALLTLTRDHIRTHRFLFIMASLVIVLAAAHLVPLPPALWQALPGREIIVEADRAAGLVDVWRPITMAPAAGFNALFSLLVPLAAFLIAVQLPADQHRRLVVPLMIIGTISGLMGIAQVAGDPNGPLYLYRITNHGSAVGLFSNRNHQAVLLAITIPMIALFATQRMKTESAIKLRMAIAGGAIVLMLPLILVTGSRFGLLAGPVALFFAWLIYRRPEATGLRKRTERKDFTLLIFSFIGLMLLALVALLAMQSESVKRLTAIDVAEESRTDAWGIVLQIAMEKFPVGSGSGSFVPLFQMSEPMESLTEVYFNHAHNDWLEIWMTFGILGLLLLLAVLAAYLIGCRALFAQRKIHDERQLLARTGAAVILIFGMASFVDYPLRTPSLSCVFVIACCWMSTGISQRKISAGTSAAD